jgi:hypothetical protein
MNFLKKVVGFVVGLKSKTIENIKNKGWCAIQGSNLCKTPDSLGNSAGASQIASQKLGVQLQGLDFIVESWSKLPAPLKAAILAIIDSSAACSPSKKFPRAVLSIAGRQPTGRIERLK